MNEEVKPAIPDAPPPPPPETAGASNEEKQWAMFLHFSTLLALPTGGIGAIAPVIIWQMKKNEMPSIDVHGKIVVNWILSTLIYSVVCFILTFLVIGIFGFMALGIMTITFAIIGGIKANNGEVWPYPCSLQLIK